MIPVIYSQGLQAVASKPTHDGIFRHAWTPPGFFLSPADAAPFLEGFQLLNEQGENIYFPIAAFRPDAVGEEGGPAYTEYAGRRQSNVLGCSVLVLDLDYLKYDKDLTWALALLDTVVAQFNLPTPTLVVDTGGGIHGYWHLDEVLAPPRWLDLAHRLANVFRLVNKTVGRVIDTQCTVDICRVLRVPGFHNCKYPNRPLVQVVRAAAALLAAAQMTAALASVDPGPVANAAAAAFAAGIPAGAAGATLPGGLVSAFADAGKGPPASWQQIRDKSLIGMGCEVLRTVLVDNNAAGYEVWSGLLSIIQQTDGGDEALRAVSAGHKDYGNTVSLQDCRNKAASFHSPRTCAQMADAMPEACARCPNAGKFKSPIMLGRGGMRIEVATPNPQPAAPDGAQVAAALASPPDTIQPPTLSEVAQIIEPAPPCAEVFPPIDKMFRYREGTAEVEMRQETDTPGVVAYGVILNRPMWLEYAIDNRVCLGMYDRSMTKHLREFDASKLLAGNDWGSLVAWMTPRGVHPMFTASRTNLTQHPVIMLIKSLLHSYGASRQVEEATHFGPSTETRPSDFILGTQRYTAAGGEPETVRIPDNSPLQEHLRGMEAMAWSDCMQVALEFGKRLGPIYAGEEWAADRWIICSALAASLSPFVIPREMQGGVIVVSSPGSGEAKSATLTTAASLYTNNPSTLRRTSATPTAVFKTLLPRLNAVPLLLDDWDKQVQSAHTADVGQALNNLIVQSTNLRPKALANGEVTPGWWSTWLYLATNSDVAEYVSRTETGGMAAGMRFLDVPIPTRQSITAERQAAYEAFRRWSEEYSGQTGHAWVRSFLPHVPYLQQRYQYWQDRLRADYPDLSVMAARFLRAMVCCTMTAAEAAAQLQLLPFNDMDELYSTGCRLIGRQLTTTDNNTRESDGIAVTYLAANVTKVINMTSPQRMLMSSATEIAAAIGPDDLVLIPVAALNEWLRRTNKSASHLPTRLKRKHPDMVTEFRTISCAGLTLSLRCYVMTIPGIAGKIEAGHMAVIATPPSVAATQRVH